MQNEVNHTTLLSTTPEARPESGIRIAGTMESDTTGIIPGTTGATETALAETTLPEIAVPETTLPENIASISEIEDFSSLLAGYGISCRVNLPYLEIGEPAQTQGWILHLSVIPVQYKSLLMAVLPELKAFGVAFKIVATQKLLKQFNNGLYGNQKVGKAITLFIEDGLDLPAFSEALLNKTSHFTGPRISTDYRFRHNLYYRYGSFKPIIYTDSYGNKERLMRDQSGNLIKDVYNDPPPMPNWLQNPFADPVLTAAVRTSTATRTDTQQQVPKTSGHMLPVTGSPAANDPVANNATANSPVIKTATTIPTAARFFSKYRPFKLLKADKKGDVYQGIYFRYGFLPRWCIIKQGRAGHFADEQEADIRHRLVWQYQLMQELHNSLSVPTMLNIMQEAEQTFIVMTLVEGIPIAQKTFRLIKNRPWYLLSPEEKIKILDYLLQVINQIQILHDKGYIHRDITGTNFLVTHSGQVFLIDLELAYHPQRKKPALPYQQGTPGYMSPQQQQYDPPRPEDDLYALGALIQLCLTGIEPALLIEKHHLEEKLLFFLRDPELVTFLLSCLSPEPADRPTILQITTFLKAYRQRQINQTASSGGNINWINPVHSIGLPEAPAKSTGPDNFSSRPGTESPAGRIHYPEEVITDLIQKSIHTLAGSRMTHEGLWFSPLNNPYDTTIYPLNDKTFYSGLYKGVGGPLYVLNEAHRVGFDIEETADNRQRAWQFIEQNSLSNYQSTAPGLYFGSSGIALLITRYLRSGLLPGGTPFQTGNNGSAADNALFPNDPYINAVAQNLQKESGLTDLLSGITGDGLAILQCRDFLVTEQYRCLQHPLVTRLLDQQRQDGSWLLPGQNGLSEKITGFGYGVAGIVYFLLEYGYRLQYINAINAADKGLNWLMSQVRRRKKHYEWRHSDNNKNVGVWWCQGGPGIALTFLKAFEYTGEETYRLYAEKALQINQAKLSTYQISLCHGAAGLGEIYLEAFRVTQNEEWKERAGWIADLLGALQFQPNEEEVYWLTESPQFPTADLMTGNSGILHFLLRYLHPEHIAFPLLPPPKKIKTK